MVLIFCIFFSFILLGWGFFFTKLLKTNLSLGLFNATACSAVLMFYSFLFSIPQLMSLGLLASGALFFVFFTLKKLRNRANEPFLKQELITAGCYLLLCSLCLVISYGLKFRSIDDYSFWGAISKYLFVFNSLPTNDHYINASFLTYIPGMASFHYLLYTLANQYSQSLGYFAQGLVLISAIMVFFNPDKLRHSLLIVSTWFILFILSYGTIFARMEVDAYVAAYLFAITWLIYRKNDQPQLLFLPILFLSTIKEIGLVFSFLTLIVLALVEPKNRKTLYYCFSLLLALLATKFLWKWHVTHYGFHSFSQGISLDSALAALNPFNDYYHTVQLLYIKEAVFAKFDYLIRIPYFLIYALIFGLWYGLLKNDSGDKKRLNTIMIAFSVTALVYLVMLYCLQAIVFAVGHVNKEILGFHRYYNMLFLPWLCFILFATIDDVKLQAPSRKVQSISTIMIILAAVLLTGGKIERMKKFYDPNQLYHLYALVESKVTHAKDKDWSICLINPPKPTYQITMPLSYFFMPHRIYPITTNMKHVTCEFSLIWNDNNEILGITESNRYSPDVAGQMIVVNVSPLIFSMT